MKTNYVLIDFENVQPENLEILKKHSFKVMVFIGANQAKLPKKLVLAMQSLGEAGQYVEISGNGKNALDFHIAYYIGEMAMQDADAYFHIISKDTGFDPLIKHLKGKGIKIQRQRDLAEIPVLRLSNATTNDEKINAIVSNLAGRGQSRPRKIKTLSNTINSLFTENLTQQELDKLIEALKRQKLIMIDGEKVAYHLPS